MERIVDPRLITRITGSASLVLGAPEKPGWPAPRGQKACRDNDAVIYKRLPRFFSELRLARDDGRFPRIFRQLVKADPLILDD